MLFFLLFLIHLSLTGLTTAMDVIRVDKSLVEIRLVLDVETSVKDPTDLTAIYIGRSLDKGLELFEVQEYNKDLPLIIVIHGFHGSADKHNPHLHALVHNNYRERFNIVALNMPLYFDWSAGNLWYILPAVRAKFVGEVVAQLLNEAIDHGIITADQINLIGFSLGAQMSGYIARAVKGEVNSILGLDPAGPGFDSKLVQYNLMMTHVSKRDAKYVHIYHTNSNTFGTTQRVATADFTFNNGWHQPGCMTSILIMCSHRRAFSLFTAIINNPGKFLARQCDSYWNFRSCRCRQNGVVDVTFPPDPTANGTYYVSTSGETPFGEGSLSVMCPKDRWLKQIKEGPKQVPYLYATINKVKTIFTWRSSGKNNTTSDTAPANATATTTILEESSDTTSQIVLGDLDAEEISKAEAAEDTLAWFYDFSTDLVLSDLQ